MARAASDIRFVPPHPPRPSGPAPFFAGLFGERARNAVYGWSVQAFEKTHIRRQVFGWTVHIPLHPDSIQRVMLDNAANYAKPAVVKRLSAPLIGRGLLMADGEDWRKQRKVVAATFTPPAIDELVPVFREAARQRMQDWQDGERLDLAEEATAATMAVIADALFGGDDRLKTRAMRSHIETALAAGSEARLSALLGLPMFGWSRKIRAGRRAQSAMHSTLRALVRERAESEHQDFLAGILGDLGEAYGDVEARKLALDNAATFYLAGHETTANAVTWALFLLSEQGALQDELAEEARAALAAQRDPAAAMPRLRAVLDETLRLYPSVPRFDREALGADELDGVAVEPGDIVSIWPWVLHRHKALWDDPDAFDADRFAPGTAQQRHRFQYFPFGAGPRTCVGMRFAITEALVVLAHWLANWRFSPVPGNRVWPTGSVTLSPEGGLPLRVERR